MPVIKKWENSLVLQIPDHIAARLGVTENSEVEFSMSDGKLVVRPVSSKLRYSLSRLLDEVTEENLHKEIPTGSPQGDETT